MQKKLVSLIALVFLIIVYVFYGHRHLVEYLRSSEDANEAITLPQQVGLSAFPENYKKKRLIISTDIGGGDPDDIQSMIHFLVYAYKFDLEGIVISRPRGDIKVMDRVLAAYRRDYPLFQAVSSEYPSPRQIRQLIKVGAERNKKSPSQGYAKATDGSRLIVRAARRDDSRPLYVLVWGAITDVAQAIHNAPDIKKKIKIYSITSSNNKGYNTDLDPSPSLYLRNKHKETLTWIESNETFRGMYLYGMGDKTRYGNVGFVEKVLKPRGRLGILFYRISADINVNAYGIKMGDTPSLLFLFNGSFEDPSKPSWGGQFCKHTNKYYIGCAQYNQPSVGKHRFEILKDWERQLIKIYGKLDNLK